MFDLEKFAMTALLALAASLPVYADGPAAASVQGVPRSQPQPQAKAQQSPEPRLPKPGKEAAEIAEINERMAVMAARLSELEMQAKIAAKKSEISKLSSSSLVDDSFIPSVMEISGVDGKIWAVLNVQGGNVRIVRVGDKVGAWRVTDIRPDSVVVKKGKKEALTLSLGLNTPQPQPPAPAGGAPVGGLPPYPGR